MFFVDRNFEGSRRPEIREVSLRSKVVSWLVSGFPADVMASKLHTVAHLPDEQIAGLSFPPQLWCPRARYSRLLLFAFIPCSLGHCSLYAPLTPNFYVQRSRPLNLKT